MRRSRASESAVQTLQKRFYQAWALTDLVSSPSHWIYLLESQPGWLSRSALSVVSGVYDPKLLLKRVRVHHWSSDQVGLTLPRPGAFWIFGVKKTSLSDVISVCELTLKLYWNRFLSPDGQSFRIHDLSWKESKPPKGEIRVQYAMTGVERDKLLFELVSTENVELETAVNVLDSNGIRLGTFDVVLQFSGQLALTGSDLSQGESDFKGV